MDYQPPKLSPDQVKKYDDQGYLLIKQPVLQPDEFNQLKMIFEEDLEKYGADDLDGIHMRDERLLPIITGQALLDLVEPLVGPDIAIFSSHFISKPPRTGKLTPWHEDSAYWEGRIDTMEGIVTVWLAIDPANEENGCMRVIPATHKPEGAREYQQVSEEDETVTFKKEIKPELVDESKAVYFELDPNECSLHDSRLIHGAKPNTSDKRRTGYTIRYFPATSKLDMSHPHNKEHRIYLARGSNKAGNVYAN
jgi:ectoine hydroxylase-related dioxygenase (phytanoyl-CoA dioxygenase family)